MEQRYSVKGALLVSALLACGTALGQAYPAKPIRVTTVAAGGALDTVIRLITQGIAGPLGQQVIVENRPSTTNPEDGIAKGVPDGYSLGYFANAVWLAPFLRANLPYDPLRDFAHVSLTVKGPNVIAVNANVQAKNTQELVALAKAKPGSLNVGVYGIGTSPTNAAVLFLAVTGVKMTEVRYKGIAQSFPDLAAGRIDIVFPTTLSIQPLAKAGKVRLLAVTSEQPSALAPDLPTVASAGYPGFESVSIQALLAPPKTPPAIVNRLSQEVAKFLNQPEPKAKINTMGFDVVGSTPAQLAAAFKSDMDKMGPVFKEAGIKPGDVLE